MRRVAQSFLVVCLAVAVPAALALGATTKQPKRSDARARLSACKQALDLTGRSLTVDASMHSLQDGDRMQMRFDLYQRKPGSARFRKLPGPGLGTWNPAMPGVDRYRFRKPIESLPAPAAYRVKVTYRWLDENDVAHARTTRLTGLCVQPDLRPDLRVAGFKAARRFVVGVFLYNVVLRNAGRTATRDFDAVLSIGGVPRPAVDVPGMAPGEKRVVELTGPRCESGATERVQLDPDNRVGESDETNNSRATTC
jgi:hypothetical protein